MLYGLTNSLIKRPFNQVSFGAKYSSSYVADPTGDQCSTVLYMHLADIKEAEKGNIPVFLINYIADCIGKAKDAGEYLQTVIKHDTPRKYRSHVIAGLQEIVKARKISQNLADLKKSSFLKKQN